jgi:hypothetical protein
MTGPGAGADSLLGISWEKEKGKNTLAEYILSTSSESPQNYG